MTSNLILKRTVIGNKQSDFKENSSLIGDKQSDFKENNSLIGCTLHRQCELDFTVRK